MSSHEAIAVVTETLRLYLFQRLGGAACTAKPPDIAREDVGDQLNLFLYQIARNGAWANMDLPSQTKQGEAGRPPLALDLSYLLTAYGSGDSDVNAQVAIGRAMRLLHDHPLLGREEIEQASAAANLPSGLHEQIERIRITHEPLSGDELSRLWTSFQTGYRISTGYKVAVVLIDSVLPPRMALPVLSRGEGDTGPTAVGDAHAWPSLERVELRRRTPRHVQPSARLGDTLVVEGHRLSGGSLRFVHQRLTAPIVRQPDRPAGATRLEVTLPNTPAALQAWPPGLWTVAVEAPLAGRQQRSNELPFPLAPRLDDISPRQTAPANGIVTYTVSCSPEVRRGQRISLLLGDREILTEPLPNGTNATATLTFRVADATPGTYLVRLRVDGVDSFPFDPDASPPSFDPQQQVTMT
jgi:hypothetical protein